MDIRVIANKLITWYAQNHRVLPWRDTQNPYIIWLSEIILQQTRVNQGLPYFNKFLAQYPTVNDLAKASRQEILRLWQGLGYYSRARNLHECAKTIVHHYNGKFPENYRELLKLKGVGPYTAAAIASFAYNEKVPVIDGNVYRVLARLFGEHEDILSTKGQKAFRKIAEALIPENQPATFNQAIMEFGALQCIPVSPDCTQCPLATHCFAYQNQMVSLLPVKVKKTKIRKRYFHYLVFIWKGKLLMKERKAGDIWSGLYDFYLVENHQFLEWGGIIDFLKQSGMDTKHWVIYDESPVFKHQLTHQQLNAKFFMIDLLDDAILKNSIINDNFVFFDRGEIENLPKPILIEKYLREVFF